MENIENPGLPVVILNPAANRGCMQRYREFLRPYLRQKHVEYVETNRAREACELASKAAREGRSIVVVGGDGTVNEVINGIIASGRRVPLGVVAAGSGNDFARSTVQLPLDPVVAIERAFNGQPIPIDAGRVNNIYFVNAFSVGIDADIGEAAGQMKRIPFLSGTALYYAAVARQLLLGYHRCPWLKFHIDGKLWEHQQEQRFVLVAVSNGPAYGSGFRINPRARCDDGLLDICTIDYLWLLRAMVLLPQVKKGQHEHIPEVSFYRARSITIESTKEVTMQADGEIFQARSFQAEIVPGALLIRK